MAALAEMVACPVAVVVVARPAERLQPLAGAAMVVAAKYGSWP
jgi:hypothetical protein